VQNYCGGKCGGEEGGHVFIGGGTPGRAADTTGMGRGKAGTRGRGEGDAWRKATDDGTPRKPSPSLGNVPAVRLLIHAGLNLPLGRVARGSQMCGATSNHFGIRFGERD
jgi:hypothetical protein